MACLLHISRTLRVIFFKLSPNVPLSETMCQAHDPASWNQVKVTGQGHVVYPSIRARSISPDPLNDFH